MVKVKKPKATDQRLNLDGKIYDRNGVEIGEYHYSLFNNHYSWCLEDGEPHHFWTKQELLAQAKQSGWTLQ